MEYITNHIEAGLERLLEQYRGKPNFTAFLSALIEQVQDVEDCAKELHLYRSIDTASGKQLDGIGEILLVERAGNESDDLYKIRLKLRILSNCSNGTAEAIIKILVDGLQLKGVHIEDNRCAISIMTTSELDAEELDALYAMLESVLVAGCRVEHIGKYDADQPFLFGNTTGEIGTGTGFGDALDPDAGGKLAGLYSIGGYFTFSDANDQMPHGGFGDCTDSGAGGRLS